MEEELFVKSFFKKSQILLREALMGRGCQAIEPEFHGVGSETWTPLSWWKPDDSAAFNCKGAMFFDNEFSGSPHPGVKKRNLFARGER